MKSMPKSDTSNSSRSLSHARSTPALKPPTGRRKLLPQEQIYGGGISAISVLTRNLPICVFEPLTVIQAAAEELRYARNYLDKMASTEDPAEQMCLLCAFIVSGYSGMIGRRRKPFNPLLGETYDYVSEDGWRYHGEQVSHHPATTACHAEGPNWELYQALQAKFSFTLFSVSITSILPVRLSLSSGKEYVWNKVTTTIQNIRSEAHKRRVINEGDTTIRSNTGIEAHLKFHRDENNSVTGEVYRSQDSTLLFRLAGSWEKGLNKILPDGRQVNIFEPIAPPKHATKYYGFNDFTVTLNEIHEGEEAYLPPTDCRFRPDERFLENAEAEKATETKKQLEKEQRKRASRKDHTPMWFSKEFDPFIGEEIWRTNRQYWAAKEAQFKDGYSKQMIQLFEKQ